MEHTRKPDPGPEERITRDYHRLVKECDLHLELMDRELPPPLEPLAEQLAEAGITRRAFMQWSAATAALLLLPPIFKTRVAKAAEQFGRVPIVWLHFAECTGCSEALLRTSYPNIDDLILETLSLEYHETLMAAAGHQAEENLEKALHDFPGKFICVIEGALPTGLNGQYLTLGSKGRTGMEIAREVTAKAAAVICIGSCSSFGNVQAASPNPTQAKGISAALGIKTVNIPGCPPNPVNFVGTLLHYLMFGAMPPLDALGRPIWAYGKRIHDYCERRPHYDAGEFVEEWGDQGAKQGWCLYKMGCKGPYTYANCAKIRFNDSVSWPIMAGHGCMGCVEPDFWDRMAPLEKPIAEKHFGGGEKTVDNLGKALAGVTAAGIAVHGAVSYFKRQGQNRPAEPKHEG
ncbi:MAG: hydrogenase small subunit [Deltaproteobacteria bacterium]|nr:hydrogenase small subunit [Deltaproteobacteria bacterium]